MACNKRELGSGCPAIMGLNKKIHAVFGQSRYVRERRVTLAQRLLEATVQPLVDIAFEAGFCSQSHMAALFVRQLGVTPAQYRRLLDGEDATQLSDVA